MNDVITYEEHLKFLVKQVAPLSAELQGFIDGGCPDAEPSGLYESKELQRRYMLGFETGRMKRAQDAIHAEYGVTR